MMKYIFLIILILFSNCTSTKPTIEQLSKPLLVSETDNIIFKPGSCYAAARLNRPSKIPVDSQNYIFEIVPPKMKKYKSKITEEELARYDPKVDAYQVLIREAYHKFEFRNELLSKTSVGSNGEGFVLCSIEQSGIYKTISKDDLLNKRTKIERIKIIGKSHLVKKAVAEKPANLNENQYYAPAGNWTKIRELILGTVCGGGLDVSVLIKKMISLGYDLEIKEILDEDCKAAILDFQKKNGLPEGNIDVETMKALGLRY